MPDEPELSQEELDELDELEAELGTPDSKQNVMLPVFGGVIIAVTAGWLFLGGGIDLFKGDAASDSLETAEILSDSTMTDTADAELVDIDSGKSNLNELRDRVEGIAGNEKAEEVVDLEQQLTDTVKSEYDSLLGTTIDEFYMLLNAQISEEETAMLSDSAFTMMLFASMEPSPYIPAPQHQEPEKPAQPSILQLTEEPTVQVDTTRFTSMIDSLEEELYRSHSEYDDAQAQNRRLQRVIDRNAKANDSLYSAELKRLAKIIESMDPLEAAQMLGDKSSEDLSMILFKVKPRQAAKIMEALPQKISAEVAAEIIRN